MLPVLALSYTDARVARIRPGADPPRAAARPPTRRLGVGSAFLPAPTAIELDGIVFAWKDDPELEDQAATALAQSHPRARPPRTLSFLYVYTSEAGQALVVVVDGPTQSIFSITEATVSPYGELGDFDLLDSVPMRKALRALHEEHVKRVDDLQAELDAQQRMLDEVRLSLARLPTLTTRTTEQDDALARFQRESEPPRAIVPVIRKPERKKPQAPPSPDRSDGGTEPIVAELSDDD
jgi:hypothetical protein